MQFLLGVTAAVFFMFATVIGAHACSASNSKSATISGQVNTPEISIMIPKPKTGG